MLGHKQTLIVFWGFCTDYFCVMCISCDSQKPNTIYFLNLEQQVIIGIVFFFINFF